MTAFEKLAVLYRQDTINLSSKYSTDMNRLEAQNKQLHIQVTNLSKQVKELNGQINKLSASNNKLIEILMELGEV